MNNFKKIISLALITTQIGCANRVVHSSLSNAQFDPNYSYTIKTNQNVTFPNVPGATLQNQPDRVYITQNNQTKYLLHNQITGIDGESYQTIGSHAGDGALIGGLSGGVLGGVLFGLMPSDGDCYDGEDECAFNNFLGVILGSALGIASGGLVGAGIGAAIPKKSQIQITPTFSPSSNQVGAGGNVSVRF